MDATFRDMFHTGPVRLLKRLRIASPATLLPNEYNVRIARRPDWVAWSADQQLCHVEFQAQHDDTMGERMLDCWYALRKQYDVAPYQVVLYVGEEKLRMPDRVRDGGLELRYSVVDLRSLDAEDLLRSRRLEDKLIAALCRVADPERLARRLRGCVERLPTAEERQEALDKLAVLCKLRRAAGLAEYLELAMPIQFDLREFPETYRKVMRERRLAVRRGTQRGLARGMERGIEQGIERGIEQGIEQGRESAAQLLLGILETKFGPLPEWVAPRLRAANDAERAAIGERLLRARTLEQVLP